MGVARVSRGRTSFPPAMEVKVSEILISGGGGSKRPEELVLDLALDYELPEKKGSGGGGK